MRLLFSDCQLTLTQDDRQEGLSDYLYRMNRLLEQTQQEHEQVQTAANFN